MSPRRRSPRETLRVPSCKTSESRRSGLALAMAALGCAALAGLPSCSLASGNIEELVVHDVRGALVAPFDAPDRAAVCLVFVAPDCPISNVYAPELERIRNAYAPRRVAFYLVYADPALGAVEVERHAADYGLGAQVLLDPEGRLSSFVEASVTPEAAVWSPSQGLVYRGRIDDLYVDFGKRRAEASQHDLRRALDAVLAGRLPEPARTTAIGCFLPTPAASHGGTTAERAGEPEHQHDGT